MEQRYLRHLIGQRSLDKAPSIKEEIVKASKKIDTLIGRHTEVQGNIKFVGGLHVEGKIIGNVVADQDSSAVLFLSDHGTIEGEVCVPHVILDGKVVGDVYAGERVELNQNAEVNGNVYYNLIKMTMGAAVNGQLVHTTDMKAPSLAALEAPAPSKGEKKKKGVDRREPTVGGKGSDEDARPVTGIKP